MNILDGFLYITTGTVKSNDTIDHVTNKAVEIFSEKIEYDYQNQSPIRPIPLSGGLIGTKEEGGKEPFAINTGIKQIVEVISVQGFLTDGGSVSAKDKRNNLLSMAKNNRELTIVWGTIANGDQTLWKRDVDNQQFGISITKMKFTETAGKYSESSTETTPLRKIDIQFQLTRAKDITQA